MHTVSANRKRFEGISSAAYSNEFAYVRVDILTPEVESA